LLSFEITDSLNSQTISNLRSLTSSLFGIAAGVLGLESWPGFLFYLLLSFLTSFLFYLLRTDSKPAKYFYSPIMDMWIGDVAGGMMGYVLTWTLFFGVVRS
jgi:ER membrane protein complex subunit 6